MISVGEHGSQVSVFCSLFLFYIKDFFGIASDPKVIFVP